MDQVRSDIIVMAVNRFYIVFRVCCVRSCRRLRFWLTFIGVVALTLILLNLLALQEFRQKISYTSSLAPGSSGDVFQVGSSMTRRLSTSEITPIFQSFTLETVKSTNSAKTVLFWTPFWKSYLYWELLFSDLIEDRCPIGNCHLSVNKDDLDRADAVVFHILDLLMTRIGLPSRRPLGQIWVLLTLESPFYNYMHQIDMKRINGLINWTMSYRWDSDIIVPYGLVLPRSGHLSATLKALVPLSPTVVALNATVPHKRNLVAWAVTNCHTRSGRELYVKELQKYIKVDIFGQCVNVTCGKRESIRLQVRKNLNAECEHTLSTYKFYLAFENAMCVDYITEKFFRTLSMGVVPVVLGGASYSSIAPANSFINARRFTPQQLADYLNYLDKNNTAYMQYFRWREDHVVINSHPLRPLTCGLCSKLHQTTQESPNSVYDDIDGWFRNKQCWRGYR